MTNERKKLDAQLSEEILERKRVEEALRESEARYRALFEGSPDAILLADPETGTILDANPAASLLLARAHEDIVGLHQSKIHPPRNEAISREIFLRHVEETSKQRRLHPLETTVVRPDGSEVPVEILAQLVTINRKKVLQGVFRDITERKQAEQALRESEERLRQVVRLSHIGIFDHDHLADTIYWSPQQREIYGVGPEETITLQVFLKHVHTEDRERIAAAVRRAHDPAGDGMFDVEHGILRRDGAVRWLETRSQTFFEGESGACRPVRTVGAVRDVTERRQTDEERQKLQAQFTQAQKMESVGRLAGGVAHDFNNMLTVILGHAEVALRQLDQDSPLCANLQHIQTAAQRSAELTRQLLAFARRQTIAPRVLDLNDTLQGMLKMLGRLIGEDIDVAWAPGRGLWKVKIDPAQVDQVLVNLLVNARDAITGKGRVAINTENAVLDEAYCAEHRGCRPGSYVKIAVSDDGCGMDEETLAHLFEPFFTTKETGRGTGLGLATVYGIIKQNEGYIGVSSEPQKGSTFEVYLPRYTGAVRSPMERPATAVKGGAETILLVEDDPMVLEIGRMLLEDLGYVVLPANAPDAAIRVTESHAGRIDLLITDVVMPDMNGRELARRLRSLYPHLRTLYMSGYAANVISPQGTLEKDTYFLQKPFTQESMAEKVNEALKGND
jgi:PAS domain S-box-containing protein